jgi:hypothetical protein
VVSWTRLASRLACDEMDTGRRQRQAPLFSNLDTTKQRLHQAAFVKMTSEDDVVGQRDTRRAHGVETAARLADLWSEALRFALLTKRCQQL